MLRSVTTQNFRTLIGLQEMAVEGTRASAVSYFYGRISRDEAETILTNNGCREGLFLLRENVSTAGNYALSICHSNRYVIRMPTVYCDCTCFVHSIVYSFIVNCIVLYCIVLYCIIYCIFLFIVYCFVLYFIVYYIVLFIVNFSEFIITVLSGSQMDR